MSTTFQVSCDLHEVDGPRIHRSHGAAGIWPSMGKDIFNELETSREWNAWLIEHQDCDMTIRRQ